MNAESLRAMLALSPAQENERRAWQAYDSALEAARSKQRPAPTPPQLLLGFDGKEALLPPCCRRPELTLADLSLKTSGVSPPLGFALGRKQANQVARLGQQITRSEWLD